MAIEITWHGHANFQLAGELNVIIDPFFTGNPVCTTSWDTITRPDIVLVTHDHGDHVGDAIEICRGMGALCCCLYDTAFSLVERGLPESRLGGAINIDGTLQIGGARITMTQAFHSSETGVPVGYVITMPDGTTVYHAGDTGLFGDMALIGQYHDIDVALLPIGGIYTMDPERAVHACTLLKPKTVIPMHWGTFPPLEQSPERFVSLMAARPDLAGTRVLTMQPGETVTV